MTFLFLSYRMVDSPYAVNEIHSRLADHFGHSQVFRDQNSLAPGEIYPRRIRRALERSDLVVAVIGPGWLAEDERGRQLIHKPRDWVRLELRRAFERRIPVVPVLLDGTPLPARSQLPVDLHPLAVSTYWQVRHRTLDRDVRELIRKLDPASEDSSPWPGGPATPAYHQRNTAHHGGTVYAAQGDQYINPGDRGAGRR